MTILITGATGLIGRALTKKCLDYGMTVHYLTTRKEKIENRTKYKGFYWNPKKNEIDLNSFTGVRTIINLAGASVSKKWTHEYKKAILDSRTQTAGIIYETLKEINHEVCHYISASGIAIYPASTTKLYTEDTTEIEQSFLGQVVFAWELAADQFKKLGIDVAKVRTGIVLSSEEGALPKISKPIRYCVGAPLGSGDQWQSWIHIDDIVGVYFHLLQTAMEGVYNAVAPNPVTQKKLTKQIASHIGKPLWLPNIPGFVLKALLGEMSQIILEGQLVSSHKLEENNYHFQYYNLETAIADLL
jgi:uncharacterized protein (TIGR01777 family)